jgi:hypothetical protein
MFKAYFTGKFVRRSRPEHSNLRLILGVFWLEKLNLSSLQKRLKLGHEFTGKTVMIWSLTLVRFIRRHVFDDLQLTEYTFSLI